MRVITLAVMALVALVLCTNLHASSPTPPPPNSPPTYGMLPLNGVTSGSTSPSMVTPPTNPPTPSLPTLGGSLPGFTPPPNISNPNGRNTNVPPQLIQQLLNTPINSMTPQQFLKAQQILATGKAQPPLPPNPGIKPPTKPKP